ncbi:hypothetical protein ACFZB9_21245 [Kitasatospora sp. NPDC008050]|uniref:hypothetical protein n=1 Tax=Kitasatospora sp. NPDC008050 TaxID=3364021 RepID=UPI0036EFD7F2
MLRTLIVGLGRADDGYVQLRLTGRQLNGHEVFADDALSSYPARTYRRFPHGPLPPEAEFDGHVRTVRLPTEAQRLSGADLLTQPSATERELSCVH